MLNILINCPTVLAEFEASGTLFLIVFILEKSFLNIKKSSCACRAALLSITGLKWAGKGLACLVSIISVIVAISFIYGVYKIGQMEPLSAHTASMEIVHIKLDGNASLYIPKSYIKWQPAWEGGDQNGVKIEAILPDMRPVAHAPKEHAENKVIIALEKGYPASAPLVRSKQDHDPLASRQGNTDLRAGKPSKIYLDEEDARKNRGLFSQETTGVYIIQTLDGRQIEIGCSRKPPVCRVRTNFDEYVAGRYILRHTSEYWKDVDDKVVALVRSFRQPPLQEQENFP